MKQIASFFRQASDSINSPVALLLFMFLLVMFASGFVART